MKQWLQSIFYKKTFGAFVLVALVLPQVTLAAVSNQQLLTLIESLLRQVAVLQAMLDAQRQEAVVYTSVTRPTPYNLQFFDLEPERVYRIDGGVIVGAANIGVADQTLFNLLRETIGTAAFADHDISEFWTFQEEREVLSGFVERRADTGTWIVGVNTANFDVSDEAERRAFQELFVHEYAHIVLLDDLAFAQSFREQFWTTADARRSEQLGRLDPTTQFDSLQSQYKNQSNRFISPYAMLNVDEDIAETFVAFVERERPSNPRTLVDEKIAFFWQYPTLRAERERLWAQQR